MTAIYAQIDPIQTNLFAQQHKSKYYQLNYLNRIRHSSLEQLISIIHPFVYLFKINTCLTQNNPSYWKYYPNKINWED